MPVSTRELSNLPVPLRLEALARAIATLEIVLCPDWRYRYYHYDAAWSPAHNDRLFKMENGSGDDYFLVFSTDGAFLKGFAHESAFTPWAQEPKTIWPGVLEAVPRVFERFLNEPAFSMESTTFCLWRTPADYAWKTGPIAFPADEEDPDGSRELLWMLDDNPQTYQTFCAEYYETQVPLEPIRAIYAGEPLTGAIVRALNSAAIWADVLKEVSTLPYPVSG